MVKANVLVAISERIAVLDAQVAASKAEEKSVGLIKRLARALKVIADLINPWRVIFVMKEGDSILDLLARYKHVKDAYKRMLAQADSMGLKLVGSTLVKK